MEAQNQPDRVSVSIGRKINLGNYESYDFHVSYSSDLEHSESIDAGYQRVTRQVQKFVDQEEYKALRLAKSPSEQRSPQTLTIPYRGDQNPPGSK